MSGVRQGMDREERTSSFVCSRTRSSRPEVTQSKDGENVFSRDHRPIVLGAANAFLPKGRVSLSCSALISLMRWMQKVHHGFGESAREAELAIITY